MNTFNIKLVSPASKYYFCLSFIFILFAPFLPGDFGFYSLSISQFFLFLPFYQSKRISCSGSFLLMSFLFFSIRPLYILFEDDFLLLNLLFKINPSTIELLDSMFWASLASFFFAISAYSTLIDTKVSKQILRHRLVLPFLSRLHNKTKGLSQSALLLIQISLLMVMVPIASLGRSIYSLGAFVYDLPMPLQSVSIFISVYNLHYFLKRRTFNNLLIILISFACLFYFTLLMREITIFRGFWVFGLVSTLLASILSLKKKLGFSLLLALLIFLQPAFSYLGETRRSTAIDYQEVVNLVLPTPGYFESLWDTYNSNGDLNIYDTFVASRLASPKYNPYILSWVYPFVHIIPRSIWPSKPKQGILQDVSHLNGAPYSPGIHGFFLLDGGRLWMLLSISLLGFLLASFDNILYSIPDSILKWCLFSVFIVNSLFVSRSFLWYVFWQVLYSVIPIYFLSKSTKQPF